MNGYLIETHLHTNFASRCGRSSGAEQARRYKDLGYHAIIITDHFIHGNCGIDRGRSWGEQMDEFALGYEDARNEGEKIGLEVWFGLETNFQGNEFVLTGVDKEWLKDHPAITRWSVEDQFKAVNAAGGLVIHAHPFREESYIPAVRLFPGLIHAVEVWNMGNIGRSPLFNQRAVDWAKKMSLPATGGSDAHHVNDPHGGMLFKQKPKDLADFIAQVKTGQGWEVITQPI